ncbi:hypothetical protein [Vulcaniibacterium tengchongense]|uniref:hypothetical protein n=1 Tax=Vulcaniibacterium tengchongense TaxID=1273429 RepID=UPI0013159300|nr:hypothetical protein [Vulcaniibacterium tengchongense]
MKKSLPEAPEWGFFAIAGTRFMNDPLCLRRARTALWDRADAREYTVRRHR